jgi:hypothetical protein
VDYLVALINTPIHTANKQIYTQTTTVWILEKETRKGSPTVLVNAMGSVLGKPVPRGHNIYKQ